MTQGYYEVWYTDDLKEDFDISTWLILSRFKQGVEAYEYVQELIRDDKSGGYARKYLVLHVELLNYYTSGE